MSGAETCSYPRCHCPFDAPADPNWCARRLPKPARATPGADAAQSPSGFGPFTDAQRKVMVPEDKSRPVFWCGNCGARNQLVSADVTASNNAQELVKLGTVYADAAAYDQTVQNEDSRASVQAARAAFVAACGVSTLDPEGELTCKC